MNFPVPDLVADLLIPVIKFSTDPRFAKCGDDFGSIGNELIADREHGNLNGRKPCRKRAGEMFDKNTDETLYRTHDGTMYHHRSLTLVILIDVFKVKALGHLEIELYGCQLPGTSEGVTDADIDFRTVKRTVTGIQLVINLISFQRFGKPFFGSTPECGIAHCIFWSGTELVEGFESKHLVKTINKLEQLGDFFKYLIRTHIQVSVVHMKLANAKHAVKSTGKFVSMIRSKLGITKRQIAITAHTVPVYEG